MRALSVRQPNTRRKALPTSKCFRAVSKHGKLPATLYISVSKRLGHRFSVFRSELLVVRILLAQFAEQFLRQRVLLFAACGQGKDDFGEWPKIPSVFHGLGDLLHTELLVTVNSAKPKREPRTAAL